MGFLYQPQEKDELRELEVAARVLGLRVQHLEIQQRGQGP
jgi:hypothetical protein